MKPRRIPPKPGRFRTWPDRGGAFEKTSNEQVGISFDRIFPATKSGASHVQQTTRNQGSYYARTSGSHADLCGDRFDAVTFDDAPFAGDTGPDCDAID